MAKNTEKKLIINANEYGKLRITRATYTYNENLAVMATDAETEEPFGTITVNTNAILPDDCACIDTNNMPFIEEILINEGIAAHTGITIPSGFCVYPVMKFNLDKIPDVR